MSQFAREVAFTLNDLYRDTLTQRGKVVTGQTIDSLEVDFELLGTDYRFVVSADKSLLFIQTGRRKGAKYPMKKVNGEFVLVDRLKLWKDTVGFNGPDFILARSIVIKGIKGVPITDIVIERFRDELQRLARTYLIPDYTEQLKERVKTVFEIN